MKKLCVIILMLSSLAAFGQRQDVRRAPPFSGYSIQSVTTDIQFTNAVFSAPTNGITRTLIYIPDNTSVIIPTNYVSLARPYVDYYVGNNSKLSIGTALPGGVFDFENIFYAEGSSIPFTAAATTNYFFGPGSLICSNGSTPMFVVGNAGTVLDVNVGTVWCADTNYTIGGPILTIDGSVACTSLFDVDLMRNDNYDCLVILGTMATCRVKGKRAVCRTQILECGVNQAVPGTVQLWFDLAERTTNTIGSGERLFDITDNVSIYCGEINLYADGFINGPIAGAGTGILTANRITQRSTNVQSCFQGQSYTIRNAVVSGGTNIQVNVAGPNVIFDSVTFTNSGSSAVNTFTAAAAQGVKIRNSITIDKGISDNIALNGGLVFGPPWTNSYTGTNVFFNIGGYNKQVLIVTNAMLLLPTNSTALESGKEVTLTMIHNGTGSTNDNVVVAPAGIRFMGGGQVTANAPLRFDMTNLSVTTFKVARNGTNNVINIFRQQP